MDNVIIYTRISTKVQDCKRQVSELEEFSTKMGWNVIKTFEETSSGVKKNEYRPVLLDFISFIRETRNISKVCILELSRLGRNSVEIFKIIDILHENGISLYIKNYNIESLDEKLKVKVLTEFMIKNLAIAAEQEVLTLRMRLKSGYDNYRKDNKVGRKIGYVKSDEQVLLENKDIVRLLKPGIYSIRKIMKLCNKSSGTVQKVKSILNKKNRKSPVQDRDTKRLCFQHNY